MATVRTSNFFDNVDFATKEAFKRLRTNIIENVKDNPDGANIIGVTSCEAGDGKSSVMLNTAYSLAELGYNVLIIDMDLRRPSLHTKLGLKQSPGLCGLLDGENEIHKAIQTYKTPGTGVTFDIIASGGELENPSERIGSRRMESLLKVLSKTYGYILLDMPPIGAVVDSAVVGKFTSGLLFVIRENVTLKSAVVENVRQFKLSNVKVLGFVVNGALEGSSKGTKYGNYSNSYYKR